MRRTILWLSGLMAALAACAGCVVEPPPPTAVELVNTTGLDVRPNLYASASASDAAGLFVGANLVTDFTDRPFPELRAGESVTLTRECEDIQSIGVEGPVLFDALQLIATPSADRIFLVRETDFQCGGTVRFVYFTEGDAFRVRVEFP
jgi:hypothetical protein